MKSVIAFAAFLAVASAALLPNGQHYHTGAITPGADATAHVISQESDIAPDHSSYKYGLQTSNGISASESGQLTQPRSAEETAAYTVQGSYSFTAADGQTYTVQYTADADGYHPQGAHLPHA